MSSSPWRGLVSYVFYPTLYHSLYKLDRNISQSRPTNMKIGGTTVISIFYTVMYMTFIYLREKARVYMMVTSGEKILIDKICPLRQLRDIYECVERWKQSHLTKFHICGMWLDNATIKFVTQHDFHVRKFWKMAKNDSFFTVGHD